MKLKRRRNTVSTLTCGVFAWLLPVLGVGQSTTTHMVSLGGYALHVLVSGREGPVVVFESGLGEPTETWNDVQPKVASFARTVLYDRAGIGKSEVAKGPRTVQSIVKDLHSMLKAANVPPPYILVGHSFGGLLVQLYAHSYPNEVTALVLIDPADPRLDTLLRKHMTATEWAAHKKAIDDAMPQMPAPVLAELQALEKSTLTATEVLPLPQIPVVLLTGTKKNPEFPGNPLEQDLKLQLHNQLLAEIPNSKHVLVANSRHYIQNDAPDLVIQAIQEVISESASRPR